MIHSKIVSDFVNHFQGSPEMQYSGHYKSLILITLPKYMRKKYLCLCRAHPNHK